MSFKALNNDTAVEYVMSDPALKKLFPNQANIKAREIGDGNLNQVFFVGNEENSVIIKQALPYLRVAGESSPLTLKRMHIETQALLLYNKLVPGLVPKIYKTDETMALIVMENLKQCEEMRKPLVERKKFPNFPEQVSTFLASALFYTSDLYLTGPKKKELQMEYINPDLCKMQEDFVFTNPFMDSPDNHWNPEIDDIVKTVRSDSELKIAIAKIKEGYMTHAQAVIHNDLHTGSIMLNDERSYVIDPECCFCGPMGFDIGALLENIILNYLSHFAHTPDEKQRSEYQEYLLGMVHDIWTKFAEKFDKLWAENPTGDLMPAKYWDYPGGAEAFAQFRKEYILGLLRDTAAFGGCKMLRRMMGIVSVWDISSIKDNKARAVCERKAIRIGRRWVLEHDHMNTIDDLLTVVREEAAK